MFTAISMCPVHTVGWCNSGGRGVIGSPQGVCSTQLHTDGRVTVNSMCIFTTILSCNVKNRGR